MTEQRFPDARHAALALLNGNQRLSRKAGQFLGQLAVSFRQVGTRRRYSTASVTSS